MITTSLTTEIIKRIFLDIGIDANGHGCGVGLLARNCFLDKTFVIDYDNGVQTELPVWAGKIDLPGCKIKGLLVDLTYPNSETTTINKMGDLEQQKIPEFALAFQVENNPIYLLRLAYDLEDLGYFLIDDNGNCIVPSILTQANALIGMETIVNQGLIWDCFSSCNTLFTAVSKIIEM